MSRRAEHDMDEDEGGSRRAGTPLDLRRLVRVVWQHKRWVVGAAAVGLVVGVLVAKFAIGRSYLTSAVVRYEGLAGQSFLEAQQELPSLASVALTDRFVLEMRDRAGLGHVSVDAMRAILQVSADQGTRQVSFNAYADTPEEAAARILPAVARRRRELYLGRVEILAIYLQRFTPWLVAFVLPDRLPWADSSRLTWIARTALRAVWGLSAPPRPTHGKAQAKGSP